MSYLGNMYGRKSVSQKAVVEKNPNRVLGGLKGAGVDTFTMLGEDGLEQHIPTKAYVQGIEEKLRKLEMQLAEQDKRIRRLTNDQKVGYTKT
jgi:hypothetical protein|tara:strand:- start:1861 stop:2136 length:276 start_codon:yes stop_codon:yes gene_type:complete